MQARILTTILTLSALIATGCATKPSKIGAQYISPQQYRHYDCSQLAEEQTRVHRRTGELYHSLKKEASADAWQMGVGLILFWPTLFALEGGDGPEATEYARLKGEYEALRQNSVERRCQLQFSKDLAKSVAKK